MLRRVLPVIACVAFASTPQELWKQAVELHQSGRYEQAAEAYTKLLQASANFVPALSNLGAVYAKLGRYEEAAQQYRRALAIEPTHFGIRLNLALALYNQARLSEAAAELERLHDEKPGDQQSKLLLADCWLRMGQPAKVVTLLSSEEKSEDRAVAYLLGTALIRDGQIGRGQAIIDRLFKDESAEGLMLLGSAQIAAQENKKALESLARAIAKKPDLPELHSLYGMARLTDGDPAGAKEAFHKELTANPNDFEANLQLGALYRVEKEYDQAAKYLGRARQVRPHSLPLKYQLAALELATGDIVRATSMLEEVTRDAPSFVEGHITLATAYYRQKRKADGDRERSIVDKLNAEIQARDLKK